MISSSKLCDAAFLLCDIRGFSSWMSSNQFEASDLLDRFYSTAFEYFGGRKEQKYPKRVAKLLGDGFLVVHEYDKKKVDDLHSVLKKLATNTVIFRIDFYDRLAKSTVHEKHNLKCAFGLSYGPCLRIRIPGYPLDYISDKINYASRLVAVASSDEVVFEIDLWDYINGEKVFNKRKDNRELKNMGNHEVGVFDTDV